MLSPANVTVAILCHSELALVARVVPRTIDALCSGSSEPVDVVIVVDGGRTDEVPAFVDLASEVGASELRLRDRRFHCAKGDASNNGHLHTVTSRTRYLIEVESDVLVERVEPNADPLREIVELFEAAPALSVVTRVDDHDVWQWPLRATSTSPTAMLASVNRVASHFLAYDTHRLAHQLPSIRRRSLASELFDTGMAWYNYEDFLSDHLAEPAGPGLGYWLRSPVRVFHCDRKDAADPSRYSKGLATKIGALEQRLAEVERFAQLTVDEPSLRRSARLSQWAAVPGGNGEHVLVDGQS